MGEDLKILILEDVPFDAELINRELEKSGMKFSFRRVEEEREYLNELIRVQTRCNSCRPLSSSF